MKQFVDPYEPTPEGFHMRVEHTLSKLINSQPPKRYARRLALIAAAAVLLMGTALALENLGVLHFFTNRYEKTIQADNIVAPVKQSCDSELLNATLRDAYWDGERLSISVNVYPKNPNMAFYTETDVGTDGESFDKIWWKGEILPFDEWRNGRETIELLLPYVTMSVPSELRSWDWVQDEQGETLLINIETTDMTQGAELAIKLKSRVLDTEATESATLTATLPAMTAAPQKEDE